jgi:ribosomal protein L21E
VLLLLACCLPLALDACSKTPPNRPNRGQTGAVHRRTEASVAGGITAPREAPRKPVIKRAELLPSQDGDQILVVVGVEHPGFYPDCSLEEARTKDARGKPLSLWYDEDATETVEMTRSYVYIFHEDPSPSGKVADPRKTAYQVVCADGRSGRAVEAHVEGTPEASP